MKRISLFTNLILTGIILVFGTAKAQETFYDIGTIQQIEISFTQSNWDYILDTAKAGSGSYLMADWVKINGIQYDSAGVKYKGSSSYDPNFAKNPLHISLDEFKNQSYQGITSVKLANFYGDPSMIREPLAYSILANYMDCPRSNFARVSINGNLIGLYSNDESVNKKFCSTHFYSSDNTFIKGSPVLPGPYSKSNLKYISDDSTDYFGKYEIESDHGWNDLVELCDILTNEPAALEDAIDIDRALWMLAFNNLLASLDSYSGWFAQNYYLYKDNNGNYKPVIWDLNMAFGGFPFAGTQNGGSGSLTIDQLIHLAPSLHQGHSDWPLINSIMLSPIYWRMYMAHMKTIAEEHFSNGDYLEKAQMMQDLINTDVQNDPNKFFTVENFQQGLSADVPFGSYTVPGIQNLMDARIEWLLSTYFNSEAPQISSVQPSSTSPSLNETVTITAFVTGPGGPDVRLNYRHNPQDRFTEVTMHDDGNHNDGEAGDQIYGASMIMSTPVAHYYIYSENPDAGKFSPEKAAHEFYTLNADIPTAQPGDVVINEFLAKNNTDTVNEYGNHEDWIELINLKNEPVNLFGLYLTDDYDNPVKFEFPENTVIQPDSYLLIWADEEDTVSGFLHANFKLSGDGEMLMLSDGAGLVLDSLTFGPQEADISWGRCPNGSGAFESLDFPTYDSENYCPEGYSDFNSPLTEMKIIPNPVSEGFSIQADFERPGRLELISYTGIQVFSQAVLNANETILIPDILPGLYFCLFRDDSGRLISTGKLIKL